MALTDVELPFLSNFGLMLTYRCTTACPHCVVEAGPHRTETMALDHALDWIDQAKAYGAGKLRGLALTGGEPFTDFELLAKTSEYGRSAGFVVSAVTNAFWATSREAAREVLSRLPAIKMLSISTDVHHQKTIPFEYVHNALLAARELDRLYNIAVCTDSRDDPGYRQIIRDLHSVGEVDTLRISIIFPVGRAERKASTFNYRFTPDPPAGACGMASSPVVFPNGDIVACIGPVLTLSSEQPMALGNALDEPLADIFDRAERNLALHTIRAWGPHRLVSLLEEAGYGPLLPREYISGCACDVCHKLLSEPSIVSALDDVFRDEDLERLVAYARLYYMDEPRLAEILNLDELPAVSSH